MAPEMPKLSPRANEDVLRLLLGKKLGEGVFRQVYASRLDPETVVKIEDPEQHDDGTQWGTPNFQNMQEWSVWHTVKGTKWEPWFAPCLHISPCGLVLVQKRARTLAKMPEKLPNFIDDTHLKNLGEIDGRPVIFDYACHDLFQRGLKDARLIQTPKWCRSMRLSQMASS